jgi:hypothetical protein
MVAVWLSFLHYVFTRKIKLPFGGLYGKPLIIFFASTAVTFIVASESGMLIQLKHVFGLFYYLSYCYVAWVIYATPKSMSDFTKIIALTAFVMALYGVFCYLSTSNPYLSILENAYGESIIARMDEVRAGLDGRIQSTMSHPLTWGGCCCVLFLYFLKMNTGNLSVLKYSLLFLLSINLFLTGSRSVILAFIAAVPVMFYYANKKQRRQIFLLGTIIIGAVIVGIYLIPQLKDYKGLFESTVFFWDENVSREYKIRGSSVSLRALQLAGSLAMIQNNILFGLGHGYVNYYGSTFGQHPILYGFESLVFNKLVECGIIGLLTWFYLFFVLYRNISKFASTNNKQECAVLKAYVASYFVYGIFTGFMQTFLCFVILYVVQVKYLILKCKRSSRIVTI